jgi:hypothetical protein
MRSHISWLHMSWMTMHISELRDVAKTPTLVLADVANFCHLCKLPDGKMFKTPNEAQALFPRQATQVSRIHHLSTIIKTKDLVDR